MNIVGLCSKTAQSSTNQEEENVMPNPKDGQKSKTETKPKLMFGSRWDREQIAINKLQLDVNKEVQSRKAKERLPLPPESGSSPATELDFSQNLDTLKEIQDESTCFCPSFSASIKSKGSLQVELSRDKEHLKASVKLDVNVKDELKKPKTAWQS